MLSKYDNYKTVQMQMLLQFALYTHLDDTGQQKNTFRLLPEENHLVYTNWGMLIPNMQTEFLHHVRIFSYDDMPL